MNYRDLRKALRPYGIHEEVIRGKGSHRYFVGPDVDGWLVHYTLPYHGDNTDVHPRYIKALERTFGITLA